MASTPITSSLDHAAAGDGVEVTPQEARQARPGRRVLMILAASVTLVVIAFAIAFLTNPTTPVSHANRAVTHADASSFHAPEPQPKTPG